MLSVSALVVAYGAEPELGECLDALLASVGVSVDVVLVDNGDTSGAVTAADGRAGVRIVRPGDYGAGKSCTCLYWDGS